MLHAAASTRECTGADVVPVPISVVVLTYDEQHNIGDCLESCQWCDDVHVVDSGSGDHTCQIASAMGASVYLNPFQSFGQQRNWAIDHIPCRHPWHFHLDADERFTPELVAEMLRELGPDGSHTALGAYRCPSKMILMARWIRHSSGYPAYQVRLFNPKHCRFVDFGHGQREICSKEVGTLVNPYTHYAFSKGLTDWLEKHNRYSSREAIEGLAVRLRGRPRLSDLLDHDRTRARRAMKDLSFFLRGRGLWRFVYLYLLQGGFLDGLPGFHYCAMIAMYEYWIELKMREHQQPWTAATDRLTATLLTEPS